MIFFRDCPICGKRVFRLFHSEWKCLHQTGKINEFRETGDKVMEDFMDQNPELKKTLESWGKGKNE